MRSEEPAGDHAGVRAQGLSAPITDSAAHTPPFEPTKLEEELARLAATHITLASAMTWLRYPGRVNGTATSDAVDFNTPGGTR